MNKYLIIFVIFLGINRSFASSLYNISRSDLKAANNIKTLITLIDENGFNSHIINRTHKSIKNSQSFKNYLSWIEQIQKINQSRYPTTFSLCNKNKSKSKNSENIEKVFEQYVMKVCDYKIISQLLLVKNAVINYKYISEHIDRLDNNSFFLENLRKLESKNNKINKLVEDYILSKTNPSSSLIKHHNISLKLTSHLQKNGFAGQLNSYLIKYSLSLQIKDFYSNFDSLTSGYVESLDEILAYAKMHESFDSYGSSEKLLSLGKYLLRRKETKYSRKIFLEIAKTKNKTLKERAQYNYLWSFINDLDYDDAIKNFYSNFPDFKVENVDSDRLKFWVTYSHYSEGEKDKSVPVFKELINNSPLSYYSIISSKLLRRELEEKEYSTFIDQFYKPYLNVISMMPKHLTPKAKLAFKRIYIWSKIDEKYLLSSEIDYVLSNFESITNKKYPKAMAKQDTILLLSEILHKSNQHIKSFTNLYRAISSKTVELNTFILEKLFPLPKYTNFIFDFKDIDPVIVISLIRQESGFNAEAVSPVGARGLMQLMPGTAKRFNNRIKIEELENPKKNINIGVTYLKELMSMFEGNLVYSLAAYNAGENRVHRWREKFLFHESILHNIENIPYDETKNYVKLIFRNIFFYKLIKEKKVINDDQSMNQIFDVSLGFKH